MYIVTEGKFETCLYECAVNELGADTESQEVERLIQMGCRVAWVNTFNLELKVSDITRRIQLVKTVLSSGDVFYVMPWDTERNLFDQIGGDWLEVDREPIVDTGVEWSSLRGSTSVGSSEPGVDEAMREVWGDEFELPEVGSDESLPEADEWRRQLSEEFGDEHPDDDPSSTDAETKKADSDNERVEGLDWDLSS